MAARPRIRTRANWPDNLHEPRPGYYVWRNPLDKKTHVLGRMPLAQAIVEAQEANAQAERARHHVTLAQRLAGADSTIGDLLLKMSTEKLKPATLVARRHYDKVIREAIGGIVCSNLTTKHVADLLEPIKARGKLRWAQAIRSRLNAVCIEGIALGLMEKNPVSVTKGVRAEVQRRRLTLDEFRAILEKAPEVAPWLSNAMLLAIVSGQDRSTVARWEKDSIVDDVALVRRPKTGAWIAIPLAIHLNAIGLSLEEVIERCKSTSIKSRYLIHQHRHKGPAKPGDHVKIGKVTEAFAKARALAGIEGDNVPTFHEIRSLSKRLYEAQGGVDTKALLGHADDRTANLYANVRGIEPIRVKVDQGGASSRQPSNEF